ncbi:hypothetical protein P3T76_010645 [Phytophthora citrophthora]|uniref:Uncharacterized protein n=1 Tax=Phytophthora citrophthora TaxID=4793 RepID=A0AAD9LGB3_9STRA|nr:hypothetical protein P3T76_010645 [Phytophthora citrophthora]
MMRDLVSRTNNPLECFHRRLNEKLKVPHPAITRFVGTIESLAREYVIEHVAVQSSIAAPPRRNRFQLPRASRLPNISDIVESEVSADEEDELPDRAEDESCTSAMSSEGTDDSEQIESGEMETEPVLSFDYDGET